MIRRAVVGLGILATLLLAGWNIELRRRVGQLEDVLSRRPAEPWRVSAAAEPLPSPPEPAPQVPPPPPEPDAPVPPRRIEAAPPASPRAVRFSTGTRPVFVAALADGSLTPEQRRAVAEIRRSADEQARAAREVIERIEQAAESALRNLLTAEQLARLDSGRVVAFESSTPAPAALPPGSRSGYLGVVGQDAPGGGVRIGHVVPGTAAAAGGLQPGDVVLEADGVPLSSYAHLLATFQALPAGTPLSLRIRRGSAEFYQGFQLGHRP